MDVPAIVSGLAKAGSQLQLPLERMALGGADTAVASLAAPSLTSTRKKNAL